MEQKKDSKGRKLRTGEDQQKNGRYRYRYTDSQGVRQTIYSWKLVTTDITPKGKKDGLSLRELEKNIAKDLDDGILTKVASSISVYEQILRYLDTKPRLANSTLLNYLSLAKRNIKPTNFGQMKVANVRKSDVQKYYAYLYKEKHFSPATIQLYQNIIYPAFQLAVDDDLIRKNPCRNCMKDYSRGGLHTAKQALTRQEQNALMNYVKNSNTYSSYYPMLSFMLGTGCRIGEVLGLTWNDIDFESSTVSINHQVIYKKNLKTGKTEHYIEPPKNRTNRVIPLQKDLLQIMHNYKKQTYFRSLSSDFKIDEYSNFVFLNSRLKVHTPNVFNKTLYLMRDSYNKDHDEDDGDIMLPNFSAHTFRHTFCTRMAENGMDVKVLQEIMGHKTIEVTMQVYNHVSEDRTRKEVERVASALVV